jgi:hypothetical protein
VIDDHIEEASRNADAGRFRFNLPAGFPSR